MPDITRDDFPEASERENKRADIGDDQNAEVDASERGQSFAPRRGQDVRDNVPGRYAAQGRSTWGRGEPGEEAVRRAAEQESRQATPGGSPVEGRSGQNANRGPMVSTPIADTALEAQTQRAQAGEDVGAYVDEDSEENRRASRAGEFREGSPGSQARERMRGKGEREE